MKQVQLKNKNNEKVLPDFVTDELSSNSHVKVPSVYALNSKIIIENINLGEVTIPSQDTLPFNIPNKDGYTAYILKPIVEGDWSDKFAVYVPYNKSRGFGIRNDATVSYTWTVSCDVLYVKNISS